MNSRLRAVTASVLLVALFTPPVVFSSSGDKNQTVRTTAYTHSESDHLKYGRKTALGTQLKRSTSYTSAAADWSRYPVGTTFRMKGSKTNYVIDDYGSALVGTDTIDIYQTSKSAMNHWGVRHVDIEILKWGDYEKSRQILSQRTKYQHCRQMYAAIPDAQRETKRGWFWNRKPKDTAPAPAPAATPQPEPQRALEEAPINADVMLASNDKKQFGLRHWLSGRGNEDATPTPAAQPERYRPTAPAQPEREFEPEIERTQPERSDVMLAENETTRSKNRWQWLRKLVGRDTAPEPATAPEIPAPGIPAQPQFIEEQPDVNLMLASNTPMPAPAPQRTAVPAPAPQSAPERIPAPPVPTPAPASAPVVLASVKVETPAPAPIAEPIAIARTGTSSAVKVSRSSESQGETAGQRVIFAIARPDSAVPHRKREVRALPANWKP